MEGGDSVICNGRYKNSSGEVVKSIKSAYCYHEARESKTKEVMERNLYFTTTLINDKKNSMGKMVEMDPSKSR